MTPRRKVLIVDDDVDLQRALSVRLKASGFDLVVARDGLQAVTTARREKPDAILVDLGLPGGDGFSVIERIQQMEPLRTIPIVVLSARDPAAFEKRARALGAVAYLQKPAVPAELIQTLRVAIGDAEPEAEAS